MKLHAGRFYKISKNFEFLTPKTLKNSLFIAFLRKKFWPSVLFYGSKKANFVLLGPPYGSSPPRISLMNIMKRDQKRKLRRQLDMRSFACLCCEMVDLFYRIY